MLRLSPLALAAALSAVPCALAAQTPRLVLELEGGAVWQGSNDAEIPNDGSATRFSLAGITGRGPWPAGRVYLTWNLGERHGLRALAAPLSVRGTGVPDAAIDFEGRRFAAGAPVEARYTFNSYRLTYRYRVRAAPRTTAWVGVTGKIRDATVALTQSGTTTRKDDVGFVPLLHLAGEWRAAPRWRLSLDADALAGGPGRAIDAALKAGYDVRPNVTLQAGYRTLEGGADVEETYNFAWLHYAVASIVWRP
ncbi:hypothetical protein [Roseisolibacter sp. H3M3-2]|uniref:hypothetical protein n=1 Tax=Roseisolibacter sp. H3M3-2 TaxID=3031323 RepID=UPI0023DA0C22|nr:hypothetical protein [Roseisolibacter sp. H3M3-2]MDF1501397.1 hypothetical protein [Roseisolibacter sp. H3M3-2]